MLGFCRFFGVSGFWNYIGSFVFFGYGLGLFIQIVLCVSMRGGVGFCGIWFVFIGGFILDFKIFLVFSFCYGWDQGGVSEVFRGVYFLGQVRIGVEFDSEFFLNFVFQIFYLF